MVFIHFMYDCTYCESNRYANNGNILRTQSKIEFLTKLQFKSFICSQFYIQNVKHRKWLQFIVDVVIVRFCLYLHP